MIERTTILRSLAKWLGVESSELETVRESLLTIRAPAKESDIAAAEERMECRLPIEMRDFYSITDGLAIHFGRTYDLFSCRELTVCDHSSVPAVVVTNLYENGLVSVDVAGSQVGAARRSTPYGEVEPIGTFYDHVRDSLLWAISL